MEDRAAVPDATLVESLRRLEQRLARIEEHLELTPPGYAPALTLEPTDVEEEESSPDPRVVERDLEFVVGQNWLASVGIFVLTCGVGFALLLPHGELPPWVPSLGGGCVAGTLLYLAHRWRRSFELVAGYFRGAGMALLYFAALRLCLFGERHVLAIDSVWAQLLLAAVTAGNVLASLRRRSVWLLLVALATGFVTVVACGPTPFVFAGILSLLTIGAVAIVTFDWPWLQAFLIPAGYAAHLLWLANRPWSGRGFDITDRPAAGAFIVLAYVLANAGASLWRRDRGDEEPATILAILLNCGVGYALFLLATVSASQLVFGIEHVVATFVFLGLALAFWRRKTSQIATFFYAMTGYMALSVALARLVPVPNLFIWLSFQSLIVVATALYFRSKLIVVGNFFIYAGIVATYMVMATEESGISVGLGVVALLTARILGWQRERLDLQTELMRDFYLTSAFIVFPYALYHLVPRVWVPVSWVGIAVAYYLMNLVVRSPKYRWMGHLTLLLTAFYMIVIGIFQLAPAWRIVSFLVLGSVLMVVSLIFTLVRARRREAAEEAAEAAAIERARAEGILPARRS